MPLCCSCSQELTRSSFSTAQLKKTKKICKACSTTSGAGATAMEVFVGSMNPPSEAEPHIEEGGDVYFDLAERLYSAACGGDRDLAQSLLLAKAPVDEFGHDEECPFAALHVASERGHVAVVKLLLGARASVGIEDASEYEATPLWRASRAGSCSVVGVLLNASAVPDAEINDGSTPLHIASAAGHRDVVRVLLGGRASLEHQDGNGLNALSYACMKNHANVVMLLLQRGAQVNVELGRPPLIEACKNGGIECVRLLIDARACIGVEGGQCPCGCFGGEASHGKTTPLTTACFNGHFAVVNLLLKRDVVNANRANAKSAYSMCKFLCRECPKRCHAKCRDLLEETFHVCGHCGQKLGLRATLKCSACLQVYYCCESHQKIHWPTHKMECDQFQAFADAEKETASVFQEQCAKIRGAASVLYIVVPSSWMIQRRCTGTYKRQLVSGHLKPVWKHTALDLWFFQGSGGAWFINDNDAVAAEFACNGGYVSSLTAERCLVPTDVDRWGCFDTEQDEFVQNEYLVVTADLHCAQTAASLFLSECQGLRQAPTKLIVEVAKANMAGKGRKAEWVLPFFCSGSYALTSSYDGSKLIWKKSQPPPVLWMFQDAGDGRWYITDEDASSADFDEEDGGYIRSSSAGLLPTNLAWEAFNPADGEFKRIRKGRTEYIKVFAPNEEENQPNCFASSILSKCVSFCDAEAAARNITELAHHVQDDWTHETIEKLNVPATLYVHLPSSLGKMRKCSGMYELMQLAPSPTWKHVTNARWLVKSTDGHWIISSNEDLFSIAYCYARAIIASNLPFETQNEWQRFDDSTGDFVLDARIQVSVHPLLAAAHNFSRRID
eukprot:TRINITY_DN2933_c1_g3_i1.p1 TRINITY_DN2933_c1_g3~~TRINITY_DN2933_c1_g3_i1.p1  ORF type:complete len:840 (+),score=96.83 TRINITY_DN2933_c1_g3_i1:95-2614(+)